MDRKSLLAQLKSLLDSESNFITNMANTAAFLKEKHGYFWVGFYLVKEDVLLLGPFQGPVACTRIHEGKGVCGTSWQSNKSILVQNVDEFPGHIACNSNSKSEVVVPLLKNGECIGVLDVDSDKLDDFTTEDMEYLEDVSQILLDASNFDN